MILHEIVNEFYLFNYFIHSVKNLCPMNIMPISAMKFMLKFMSDSCLQNGSITVLGVEDTLSNLMSSWYSLDASQMSTHMPGIESFFSVFASFCIGQISHQQQKVKLYMYLIVPKVDHTTSIQLW